MIPIMLAVKLGTAAMAGVTIIGPTTGVPRGSAFDATAPSSCAAPPERPPRSPGDVRSPGDSSRRAPYGSGRSRQGPHWTAGEQWRRSALPEPSGARWEERWRASLKKWLGALRARSWAFPLPGGAFWSREAFVSAHWDALLAARLDRFETCLHVVDWPSAGAGDGVPEPGTRDADAQTSDGRAPDARTLYGEFPASGSLDAGIPDTQALDIQAPDIQAPDIQAPDTRAPDTQTSDAWSPASGEAAPAETRSAPAMQATETRGAPAVQVTEVRGELAVKAAESWLGTPYTWGGGAAGGPSRGVGRGAARVGFDCSGLVMAAWAKAGVGLGHYTGTQFRQGRRVTLGDLRPGDLMFFGGTGGVPTHVGMYAGGGMMIHAPKTGDVVKKVDVLGSHHYMTAFRGAVRPG
ncbi:NlpC/P60 family protein [Microtetraspora sp. NBRC 16547]|uniref:C40 family peptidase n=1 Tax=Microtetraspora sp. NBRC 16547 TaxID=3030993 RepID=UPI0024A543EF|nr:NlpC/P60 family protein [Microtetraspora sp. NBRC 16547]GLX01756.1 hypothetical protein Misp02_58420 [Microtetraspora sp. NBRC 16547]